MIFKVTIEVNKQDDRQAPRPKYRAIAGKLLRGIAKVRVQPEWPEYPLLAESRGIEVASG